ncbi:MAG: PAS domain S-box protein [Desulfovibrionaceae bacterium]|nr:PAS domain S-box protein [Desulfovibrionaceae bacterium]MBF0513903.1 PAS domain S-box protein [Desulfovibrionaceae bacterium]
MLDSEKTREQLIAELASIARMKNHDTGLFKIILDGLPMPYLLVDVDERVIQTNQACLDMLGIDDFEKCCYGKTTAEVFYGDPNHTTIVGKSMREDKVFRDIDVLTTDHKGRKRNILANIFPLYDFDNQCIGGMSIYIDCTERKQAEEALHNSNRALKAFKESGKALIRARDEISYLTSMCNILVETCGYVMAWVGLAAADAKKTVAPVCFGGADGGYLKNITVTWDESETGCGPTGAAIRTLQPQIARCIASDPRMIPWREAAQARGYQAVVALPLRDRDVCLGALTIYASEPDAFDAGEVELLSELAGDLAFGIVSLRLREEHRRAVKALRHNKNILRGILDTVPQSIFWKDVNKTYLGCNHAFARDVGLGSYTEVIGKTDLDLPWTPEEAQAYRADDEQVMVHDRPKVHYIEHARLAGGHRWVDTSKMPLKDQEGKVYGVLGVYEDITERKAAEEALRENEELFRSLFEDAGDGIYLTDTTGRYFRVNREAERQTGFSRAELLKMNVPDLDLNLTPESFRTIVANGVKDHTLTLETKLRRKDGGHIPVELRVMRLELTSGPILMGIARDLTGRKLAEEAIVAQRNELSTLLNGVPTPIFYVNLDNCVTMANEYWFKSLGLDQSALNIPLEQILPKEMAETFHGNDLKFIASGQDGLVTEDEIRTADGWRHVMTHKILHKDATGEIIGLICVSFDVTELKRAKESAEAGDRAKSEFLATVTHELRTPMNGVLGALQLLGLTELNGEQKDYVDTGLLAANNLLKLIDQILEVTRAENKEWEINESEFLVSDLRHSISSAFEPRTRKKQLEFTMEISPDVPDVVIGDAGRIRQALASLVENAVKFTAKGGVKVLIEAGGREGPGARKLLFSVSDTGIGIPEDQISRVFTPFTQLDASSTRKYQGSGLGLAIVKRLVERMGGVVGIESALGRGTTVRFEIPVGTPV